MKPIFVICSFLLFFPKLLWAKGSKVLDANQGLSNNNVYAIHCDREGILWVGTELGLYYFDGTRFHPVDLEQGAFDKAPNAYVIQGLCEDEEGNLFIGTYDHGLFILNRKRKSFQHVDVQNTPALGTNQILNLSFYKGTIYIATAKGILSFQSSNKIKPVTNNQTPGVKVCGEHQTLAEIHEAQIEIIEEHHNRRIPLNKDKDFLTDAAYLSGRLFCTGKCGVQVLQGNQLQSCRVEIDHKNSSDDYFLNIGEFNHHSFLLSFRKGLCWIDSLKENLIICHCAETIQDSSLNFYSLSIDTLNQTILLGTNKGVRCLPLKNSFIQQYPLPNAVSASVMCIYPESKKVFLGTQKGMLQWDQDKKVFKNLSEGNKEAFYNWIYPFEKGYIIGSHNGIQFWDGQQFSLKLPEELR